MFVTFRTLNNTNTFNLTSIVYKQQFIYLIKHQNKLLIKNIAFEANLDELRSLIRQFGDVKTVRLPKQITGQH